MIQLEIKHWLVLVLPVIVAFATFFIAEAYAISKASQQKYRWHPIKLVKEVLIICIVGGLLAVLLGYLTYLVIFQGVLV